MNCPAVSIARVSGDMTVRKTVCCVLFIWLFGASVSAKPAHHYVFVGQDGEKIKLALSFLGTESLEGAQVAYSWRQLEPGKDEYDFGAIQPAVKLLVAMNLSPSWTTVFIRHGWESVHWSSVGDPRGSDRTIMKWARTNGYVLFTHDRDFTSLLATTGAEGPSVMRTQDVTPGHLEQIVVGALQKYEALLEAGALISIDEARARVRILPLAH